MVPIARTDPPAAAYQTFARRCVADTGKRLEEVNERIKEAVIDSPIAHFDETCMRICANLHWLHVAATEELTYYLPHEKRGSIAFDDIRVKPAWQWAAKR